jgi:AraC-like DNA-binding protein
MTARFEQAARALVDRGRRLPARPRLSATRSVALRFPHDWLRNWIPAPESLAGLPLRSNSGWSGALCAAVASLDTDTDEDLALPPGTVAEQMAALLALAAGPEAQAASGTEKLFARIRRTIRDRCHEAGLSPGAVAARCGFVEPSHFARRFREAFGHGPSEFRATVQGNCG